MNKQPKDALLETLVECLNDARHKNSIDEKESCATALQIADKTLEALRLLVGGEPSWICKDPHCAFKHNDRGRHESSP